MHPLSQTSSDQDRFCRVISKYFPNEKLDEFYNYDESDLRSHIHHIAALDGRDLAATRIEHAVKQGRRLEAQRKGRHYLLRGSHKAQTLAASMIDFLDSFSTIGDILKGIDPRAGGITYGTLYILLKIGHNKQQHEDLVTRGLKDFSITLNQINEYHQAHLKEERMLSHIDEAYNCIIKFAQKASMYYAQSGFRRLLKTGFVMSEKSELEEQGERVRSVIKRIVDEANAIMSRRLEMVTRHMNYQHDDSLADVRQALQLPSETISDTEKTRNALSSIYESRPFAQTSLRGRTILFQEADTACLSTAGLLDQYRCPTHSSLLLLSGTNHHSVNDVGDTKGLCWLSPITLELAAQATGPLAFYSTQYAGYVNNVRQRDTLTNIVNAILYQLLVCNNDVAKKWHGTVERATHAETWQTEPMEARRALLLDLLNALADIPRVRSHDNSAGDTKPTTIIIDRLDAISIEPAGGGKREVPSGDDLREFVEMLLEVLDRAKGIVKVVVTMHAAFTEENRPQVKHRWEWLQKDWEKKWKKDPKSPRLTCRLDWEQRTREVKGQESDN